MRRDLPAAAAVLLAVPMVAAAIIFGAPAGAEPSAPTVSAVVHQRLARQLLKERDTSRATITKLRRELRAERRFTYLVRHPSPVNNRALARILYPDGFWALDKIAAGGDGIGGKPGESDWRETVWNGGSTDPDQPGPTAQSCGGGPSNIAYGLGQACPRTKMADWAGTEGIYLINSQQLA